ncbi:MAG: hypothetical protein LQ338_003697 [Usnochroma carphineum]|nr:MAG: hypothetical protein LQ338_003697 [Usnochroma carphineum]
MLFVLLLPFIICVATVVALGPQPPRIRPVGLETFKSSRAGILNGTEFVNWIQSQRVKGVKAVALAEGSYHVLPSGDKAHIYLGSLDSMTIWMDSVNLTMTEVDLMAFQIYGCNDLKTYGPTVWWDTPGFSQATITNIQSTGGQNYDVQFHLDDGYDSSFLLNASTKHVNGEYTNPKTGRLEAGPGWSTISGTAKPVDGLRNTYTVPLSNSYFTPQVGYKLLARGSFIFCNQVGNSNSTVINDYTLLNCAGFGWSSSGNRKTTFNSFSLKPATFPPPNGTELPARSSSADGIHSSGDFIGPTFESCYFSALDDDCMAVHGSLNPIIGPGSTANSFTVSKGAAAPGDVLRFYANTTFEPLGNATVTSTTQGSIAVDHLPVPAPQLATTFWSNQNRVGSGFAVLNTHTTGNRGRGAIIKASNGIISGNLFEGVSYGAIDVGPEFSNWKEADYVHNVTITNNTVRNCNYINKAAAAVMVHGDGDNPLNGNSNITIDGLVIDGVSATNLYLGASGGLKLGNMTFLNAYRENYTLWEEWPGSVATFENVSFSKVEGTRKVVGGVQKTGVDLVKVLGKVEGVSDGGKGLVTGA